ncbi:Tetraspanin [Paragonimus heterotremus]|uniref:Tetraspanin n=1 Tax=Paragonimus heterotremus TaxID=100268 RepID=A0A8J4WJI3_9TREM|nr:Tetraspanin [Paragonimus heterotremus]
MRRPLIHRQLTLYIVVINGLYFLFGITLIVLGIYTIIDNANISELAGTALYASGVYMLIFFGLIITAFSICGCVAVEKENRCMIITYIVILCITILFLFISGVMVLVFKSSVGNAAKEIMISTLRNQYGRYKIITDAWNVTQSRLRCCGVDDLGWHVYNDSWWDVFINTDIYEKNAKLTRTSPFYKFVPESCCATIIDAITGWPTRTYRDLTRCQTWQYGPPSFTDGPHNDAIYYAGCFNSLKDYINQYGKAIGALAMITIVLLVSDFIGAIDNAVAAVKRNKWEKTKLRQPLLHECAFLNLRKYFGNDTPHFHSSQFEKPFHETNDLTNYFAPCDGQLVWLRSKYS